MDMKYAAAAVEVRPMTRLFRALGDETRLRIVALLTHGELCVCHLEDALGLSQPNASRHLTVLKSAGIVEHRRVGTWVYYKLTTQTDADCRRVLSTVLSTFNKREVLRQDVERLLKAKGPNSCK